MVVQKIKVNLLPIAAVTLPDFIKDENLLATIDKLKNKIALSRRDRWIIGIEKRFPPEEQINELVKIATTSSNHIARIKAIETLERLSGDIDTDSAGKKITNNINNGNITILSLSEEAKRLEVEGMRTITAKVI